MWQVCQVEHYRLYSYFCMHISSLNSYLFSERNSVHNGTNDTQRSKFVHSLYKVNKIAGWITWDYLGM